jgi:hypothetical protein
MAVFLFFESQGWIGDWQARECTDALRLLQNGTLLLVLPVNGGCFVGQSEVLLR